MELIKKWLSGKRNFYVGAVLYSQYGTDKKLMQLFNGTPDSYKQKRLEAVLTALLSMPTAIIRARPVNKDADTMPSSNDPVLEALRNEWSPLYQRMQYLRHELDRFEGNSKETIAQRKPIAFEILELEQQCMRIWTRRDHYLDSGNLPEVKADDIEIPDDPVKLATLIDTTKRNLRRNKKWAKDNPSNTVYPLKVIQYQELMDKINKKINDAKGNKG